MVAQELAVRYPERIERLALVCTSPGGASPSYPLHELAALAESDRDALRTRLLDTRFTPEWLSAHPADQRLVEMLTGAGATAETSAGHDGEAHADATRETGAAQPRRERGQLR